LIVDYGLITLLYQDEIGGLEVKGTNNSWTPAKPIKDAVLINAGDMLEMFTNGRLPATLHRVIIPEEEIKQRTTRQSIVFFVHPDHDTMISPLPAFLKEPIDDTKNFGKEMAATKTKEFTLGYKPISALEHVNRRFQATYQF
jgi:isopenicillin N synthase-like dioxygenase